MTAACCAANNKSQLPCVRSLSYTSNKQHIQNLPECTPLQHYIKAEKAYLWLHCEYCMQVEPVFVDTLVLQSCIDHQGAVC